MANRVKNRRDEDDLSFMENIISEMMIGGGDAMKFAALMKMMQEGDPEAAGGGDPTAVSPMGNFENIMGSEPMPSPAPSAQGFQPRSMRDPTPTPDQLIMGRGLRRKKLGGAGRFNRWG